MLLLGCEDIRVLHNYSLAQIKYFMGTFKETLKSNSKQTETKLSVTVYYGGHGFVDEAG